MSTSPTRLRTLRSTHPPNTTTTSPSSPSSPSSPPSLNIKSVVLGTHLLTPWFPSEYPSGLVRDPPPTSKSGTLLLGTNRRRLHQQAALESTKKEKDKHDKDKVRDIWDVPTNDSELEVAAVASAQTKHSESVPASRASTTTANPTTTATATAHDGKDGERSRVGSAERLFVCEFCFAYSVRPEEIVGHGKFCEVKQNKGRIGRKVWEGPAAGGDYEIWEVGGEGNKLFCQNLSLFSKLFVANKSISYDVDSFLFYLLLRLTPPPSLAQPLATGLPTITGYFSKERLSWDDYNLACILVFPPYMRHGLGKLMISFSYELSRREGKVGSPEKPLSLLGERGYLGWWCDAVAGVVLGEEGSGGKGKVEKVDVRSIGRRLGMVAEDVVCALREMGAVERGEGGEVFLVRGRVREWVERKRRRAEEKMKREEEMGSLGGGVGRKRVRAA